MKNAKKNEPSPTSMRQMVLEIFHFKVKNLDKMDIAIYIITHDINGGGDNMYTADNICKMIEFLIDNIFVQFGGRLFRQVIGIPMGTNCAPLLADLFLYSYENEFLDNMIRSCQVV